MANIKETKRIVNILDSIFSNNKFMIELSKLCDNSFNGIMFALGDILEYYITSRDNRILSVEEMNIVVGLFKYIGKNKDYGIFNMKDNEQAITVLRRNILRDGYMTRSVNTYFLKRIKRYGLGNINCIDKKLNKQLSELEKLLNKPEYSIEDLYESNQFCMSTPGANSFYNTFRYSPLRFFNDILGVTDEYTEPIVVGESKLNYFKRVLNKSVFVLEIDDITKKKALKLGLKVIKRLVSSNPTLLLIPINGIKYSLKVTREKNNTYDLMPINDWIYLKLMNDSPMKFFARDFGENNQDLGNIISYETIIPYKELGVLSIPDKFDIYQIIAKNKGLKKGETLPIK